MNVEQMTGTELHDMMELMRQLTARTVLQTAEEIAEKEGYAILVIHGPIDQKTGFPEERHKDYMQIALYSPGDTCLTGIYRVTDRENIGEVVDDLENHGGYRCVMINPDGTFHQGYQI